MGFQRVRYALTMRCLIADLVAEVPEAEGMDLRCRDYRCAEELPADIVIREEEYRYEQFPQIPRKSVAYLESGRIFCRETVRRSGLMLRDPEVL